MTNQLSSWGHLMYMFLMITSYPGLLESMWTRMAALMLRWVRRRARAVGWPEELLREQRATRSDPEAWLPAPWAALLGLSALGGWQVSPPIVYGAETPPTVAMPAANPIPPTSIAHLTGRSLQVLRCQTPDDPGAPGRRHMGRL